ncbi:MULTISPECIES: polysaccharide deacetylase [Desulfovibrio]|uniref:Polysaccharide deacetylase n=1 Tax=Desulfovibrio desulfuricans TaxID=876 RepID=A0AA94L2V5_DESDE|nr:MULTISPECIES: polysaccharide deacetylase [Desulfovibrio]ATD80941.1 polysaccharide deacetylase [Desulfovibrio sp. G11]SFW62115.1 hypothetical protein SAMN02910291_02135 [Desulfovibrio desulfuricans]SPD36505.1 Glycoside hydrolase/deacetylase [Desulfovibrio sp. G11]
MSKNRYALFTVDTEALPKRAVSDHVKRLIWGEYANGTAGVREMCAIGDEYGAKHIFFVDMCGAYAERDKVRAVMGWLDKAGHDVQLHVHPEYLPNSFWNETGFKVEPRYLNAYTDHAKEEFLLSHFSKEIVDVTGKPVRAFRAGSFRWNATTLRTLAKLDIPLSFNNTTAATNLGQCPFSVPTNDPFQWSNGIIEVPVTEKNILPKVGKSLWARFQFPLSRFVKYRPWWASFLPYSVSCRDRFLVCLVHSWSLLHWDENGHGTYTDDSRLEEYRRLVKQVSKDFDVVTSSEFLDLVHQGKISPTHVEDLARAEIGASNKG